MAHGVSYLCIQLIPGIESTEIPSSNRRQLSLLSSRRNSHSSGSEQREPTLSKSQTKTIKMTFLIVVGELILFYLEFSIVCSKKSIRRRRLYVFNFIVIFFQYIFVVGLHIWSSSYSIFMAWYISQPQSIFLSKVYCLWTQLLIHSSM